MQEPKPQTDWEKQKLKGEVKSICNQYFRAVEKFGEVVKGESLKVYSTCLYFNENGYVTELKLFSPDGSLFSKTIYDLDENNISSGFSIFDSIGNLRSKSVITLDKNLNTEEIVSYDENGEINSKEAFRYDGEGNPIQIIFFNAKGDMLAKYINSYDRNGNNDEMVCYGEKENITARFSYVYDSYGEVIESKKINKDGLLEDKIIYRRERDKIGNMIKEIIFENDKLASLTEYHIEYYE